ncbi:MAG: hypothetical protein COA32_10200 [Fluviicola sp.]|nr:MAG: hypothetical protein COA32_10200 [Fluviicola sp.]
MKRGVKIVLSILTIILGWILNAFAWTTKLGHPVSTICLSLGIGLFIAGIVFLIISINNKAHEN